MGTVTLTFGSALLRGKGQLSLSYTGELNNQMCGFYRSTYTDINGKEQVLCSHL